MTNLYEQHLELWVLPSCKATSLSTLNLLRQRDVVQVLPSLLGGCWLVLLHKQAAMSLT